MRTNMIVGILLIVLGVAALTYHGFTYTEHKELVNIGPIHATESHEKTVLLPPIFGGLAIAAGALMLIYGAKRD